MFKKQLQHQHWKILFIINLTVLSFIPTSAVAKETLNLNRKIYSDKKVYSNKSLHSKQRLNFQESTDQSKPRKTKPNKKPLWERLPFNQPTRKLPRTTPVKPTRKFIYFRQPQRQGTPRGTRPAGKRGCLIASEIPFSPVVPVTKGTENTELRWGITTKTHPTFWFYIPHHIESVKSAKFSLRNRNNKTIYESNIKLTDAPGIISFSLPANAPNLEINQWYQYYLFIDRLCKPKIRLQKDFAQGWVKREAITSQLQAQLNENISAQQKAILYAQNGIWYETINTLATLNNTNAQNYIWVQLLQSVGLEKISKVPIISCCSPNHSATHN
ncbi:DUF928 domain-containing protein [Mastigocoleus testarum]|uniref:DUF928 domain-containing protein n=1 Tax=Mastigocoleus testarum BC008 TaxID=371196 RepID=A0A0V7ZTV3_9CYAN|nr:DUF928 domain-containing protein [Mastigocoleus testarum]KST64454.1 hypothetical protein BC008_17640 [Mastigocoleus testarum BC008]KST67783.1 hypothetical protein BC008_44360 [Mastigocoleus testarum BC008]